MIAELLSHEFNKRVLFRLLIGIIGAFYKDLLM